MSTRVLLIEDSENDALLIERALRKGELEPEIRQVQTEQEILEAFDQESWDVVISDYSLPGINALGALLLVRQLAPHLPFIIVSGAIGEDIAAAAVRTGADDVVLKDNLFRLPNAVRRGLRDAETRRAWRRAERELQDREARFRSIIENVHDLILILDSQGNVQYQSPSVERVLGYPASEFAGSKIFEIVHADDVESLRKVLSQQTSRGPSSGEYRVLHRSGLWLTIEAVVTDLRQHEDVSGFVCTARDITDRKRAESERLRANRLESIGSLAGGIAHDLNNLLTPIVMTAEMLDSDLSEDERRTLLDGLTSSANRAAETVRHLMSFARGISPGRTAIEPAELLHELERMLRFSFPKAIRRLVSVDDDAWRICGDFTQVMQVLMNLCVNARDAMPDGGVLRIESENVYLSEYDVRHEDVRPGPFVHIRVTDSGGGIPQKIRDRIFDPFFTTKEGERGTGLGLSTSRDIIQAHGGIVRVYSEIGRGSRFSVYLPAEQTTKTLTSGGEPEDLPRGRGEWLLLVDDETSLREVVRETLQAYGYRVYSAANGAEALAVHAKHRGEIRLAIIDVAMPLVDGRITSHSIRRTDPDLPILIQGGFIDEHDGFPADVEGYIEKPYTTELLLQRVAQLIRRKDDTPEPEGKNTRAHAADHR